MININEILYIKNNKRFEDIEAKAYRNLIELNSGQRVKDDIFRILKNMDGLQVIKFPIKDDEVTAFKLKKKDIFIYINTALPLEKQIFGAAHELYHVLCETENNDFLGNYENSYTNNEREMEANSFAACFLVPKNQLMSEIQRLKIDSREIELIDIIKLMDIFAVPYKTMIIRLYECSFIDVKILNELLSKDDRDPKKDVLLIINQTRHGVRWQKKTMDVEYGNFIEMALRNYNEDIITKEKIKKDFVRLEVQDNFEDLIDIDQV